MLARIPRPELLKLFEGYGYRPIVVEGDDPATMHQLMAAALDDAVADIRRIQQAARERPRDRAAGLADADPGRHRKAGPDPRQSTACRPRAVGDRTRCRSPVSPTTPSTWPRSRRG